MSETFIRAISRTTKRTVQSVSLLVFFLLTVLKSTSQCTESIDCSELSGTITVQRITEIAEASKKIIDGIVNSADVNQTKIFVTALGCPCSLPKQIKFSLEYINFIINKIYRAETFTDVNEIQLSTAIVGMLSHEYGHILQFSFGLPQLLKTENIDSASQLREYHADFISGYLAAKVVYLTHRNEAFVNCAGTDEKLQKIISDFLLGRMNSIRDADICITQYLEPYKNASILRSFENSVTHGCIESRKRAFDAGIGYALLDGIGKDDNPKYPTAIKELFFKQVSIYLKNKLKYEPVSEQLRRYTAGDIYEIGADYVFHLPVFSDGSSCR